MKKKVVFYLAAMAAVLLLGALHSGNDSFAETAGEETIYQEAIAGF